MRMSLAQQQLDIAPASERLVAVGEFDGCPSYQLDVPETIPQLGYGSHQFFRYYGKFPSVVGAEIVQRHADRDAAVLDCYAGCGTSLVEAQHEGLRSYGIDLNPLAVLACNVKTTYHDPTALRAARDKVLSRAGRHLLGPSVSVPSLLSPAKLDKWFLPEAQNELAALRVSLMEEPPSPNREFLVLAFLGIARRVSKAYDGEVRPHINPTKRPRSPFGAFKRKLDEMIQSLEEVEALRPPEVASRTALADNRDPGAYRSLLGEDRAGLLIAHPPYLNSFNYLQVFSLEFGWSEGFEEVWGPGAYDLRKLRKLEHRAWPATDPKLVASYYEGFMAAIRAAASVLTPSARIAVVIGDATIRGHLEAVHMRFWEGLKADGFRPAEIWFRTTHYGIGKYAYSHRADYHGDAVKKDAILFFDCG
jgi:hypothetical protein